MARIGSLLVAVSLALFSEMSARAADEAVFDVSVDRTTIGRDESVALRFKIRSSGTGSGAEPEYQAPDFDEVNQYSSVFVESTYENGKFGVRNTRQLTKVLRPTRTGDLSISGIRIQLDGRLREHPPIRIRVDAAGRGTPPPPNYGGAGSGLRSSGKRTSPGVPFLIRAEVDQSKVFKGQQVIVSYYLYRRAAVHNIQVEKYPVLDGFLREDLDLPILGQRLNDRESVVLDGERWERLLLARYAAYPLKEGRMAIDSMAIKGTYYPSQQGLGADSEDPFSNMMQNFMQQLQPRNWSHRSEPVSIDVQPLPLDGRPASFGGGVGDFEITAMVDKTQVRVNEPLTLTIKIEGRGNTSAVAQPPVRWPQDLEVYETKSRMLPAKGGVSAKIFEVLLIPRRPGRFQIPELELSFFSPADRSYQKRKAAAIEVVAEGMAAPAVVAGAAAPAANLATGSPGSPDGLLMPEQWTSGSFSSSPLLQWVAWLMVAISGLGTLGIALRSWARKGNRWLARRQSSAAASSTSAEQFRDLRNAVASAATIPWKDVVIFHQRLGERVSTALETKLGLSPRAWSRAELRARVQESGAIDPALWQRIENLLELCEAVQYSGGVQQQGVRDQMDPALREAERLVGSLEG